MAYQFFLERGGAGGHGPLNAVAYQFFEFSLRNQRLLFCLTTLLLPPQLPPIHIGGSTPLGHPMGDAGVVGSTPSLVTGGKMVFVQKTEP